MGHELEETAQRVRETSGLPIAATLLEGPVIEATVQHVASTRPWLVVLTSHRLGGLRRMVAGGVADSIVGHAGVPVIIARGTGDEPPPAHDPLTPRFTNILLPLDGSRLADDIIDYATLGGEPHHTNIALLAVVVPIPMLTAPAGVPSVPEEDGGTQQLLEADVSVLLHTRQELEVGHGGGAV